MTEPTWCVWAAIPFPKGSEVGWTRIAGELTEEAADLFAEQLYFRARVMLDAGPDHRYPVMSIARELCGERHPGTQTRTGHPCNLCVDESRDVRVGQGKKR